MKKLLIIYDDFAPMNNCAAIPNTKVVKYLSRENLDITVITKQVTDDMPVDNNLITDEIEALRIIRIGYSKIFKKTLLTYRRHITDTGKKLKMKAETGLIKSALVSFLKNTFFYFRRKDWFHKAKKTIQKELKNERFDCVFSSYPDLDAHWLAEYCVDHGIAEKWVADFRDPMFYEHHDEHGLNYKKKQQKHIEKRADRVSIVSEGAMEKFTFPGISLDKFFYIPNGYDPEDFHYLSDAPQKPSSLFRIFYAGTLYAGKRDFLILFKALSELIVEGKVDPTIISVEYAGNEWPIMKSFAEQYNLCDCCKNFGYITRTKVLNILSQVDCSAVCSHNTKEDKGVVTGKVFELLLVGKPIIAVVNGDEPNSELGNIIKECNAGIVYEQANHDQDYPQFKQWLQMRYEEKILTGTIHSTVNCIVREKYSYETIAKNIHEIIRTV